MKPLTRAWLRKAEADLRVARRELAARPAYCDVVCFCCQQSAEKFLKALVQEAGMEVPRTHDLDRLLSLLSPIHPELATLHPLMSPLTRFAVEYRYPGAHANKRQATSAVLAAEKVRDTVRRVFGLRPRR